MPKSKAFTLIPYYKDVDIRVCPKAPRTVEQGGIMPWVATNRPGESRYDPCADGLRIHAGPARAF